MATRCSRLSRTLVRVLAALFVSSVSLVGVGCSSGGAQRHPSVARGELYKSGNPSYDEYFEDLYDLQEKVKPADTEDKNARKPLLDLLGPASSVEDLLRKVRARVEQVSQNKAKVHFEFDGVDEQAKPLPGKQVTVKPVAAKGKTVPKEAADLGQAFDATAKAEAQMWEKYGPLSDKVRRMDDKADLLVSHLDAEFEAQPRRDEVRRELKAAKSVLTEIAEVTDKVFDASTDFLQGTAELFASAPPPPQVKEKAREAKEKAREARDRDRKARSARAARPSEPAPERPKAATTMKVRSASDSEPPSHQSAAAPAAAQAPSPPPDFNP